jgi:hypothetical protein
LSAPWLRRRVGVLGNLGGWPIAVPTTRRTPPQEGPSPLWVRDAAPGGGLSSFIYDEEKDLFRFKHGRFAFSRSRTVTAVGYVSERASSTQLGEYANYASSWPFAMDK